MADLATLRMIESLEARVKTELTIKAEHFSPGIMGTPHSDDDSPTEAMIEKFLAAESSVTATLENYHANLSGLVEKVHSLGEKCRESAKKEEPTEGNGEEKEGEGDEEEMEEKSEEERKDAEEKLRINLKEWSAEVRHYLTDFALEAATFYKKMGALYENLHLELGGAKSEDEEPKQEPKATKKDAGGKIVGSPPKKDGKTAEKKLPLKNPPAEKKVSTTGHPPKGQKVAESATKKSGAAMKPATDSKSPTKPEQKPVESPKHKEEKKIVPLATLEKKEATANKNPVKKSTGKK